MKTPVGNPAREAVDAKRGYLYQDYATALAWLALPADEVIYVEVAEDYLQASNGEITATQVRDTSSSSLTLYSQHARDALSEFVALVEQNKSTRIRYVYLTTSLAGQEQRLDHRPAGMPGIPVTDFPSKNLTRCPLFAP